jgi:hypothetical protein
MGVALQDAHQVTKPLIKGVDRHQVNDYNAIK